jgi:hypothetical protein
VYLRKANVICQAAHSNGARKSPKYAVLNLLIYLGQDPESYTNNAHAPTRKKNSAYGMAGVDNLDGNSNAPAERRGHPLNDASGARRSTALPSFTMPGPAKNPSKLPGNGHFDMRIWS